MTSLTHSCRARPGDFLAAGLVGLRIAPSSAESARVIAPPVLDEPAGQAATEVAVLAGGCFWGVQGVFQHVEGVTSAVSGYAGGAKETAEYDKVGSGRTGHAEAVRITYDPRKVSYGRLLQIYFSVAHDPTELNRQGPDVGTQYRSTIFPTSEAQAKVAKAYIEQLDQARAFGAKIATTIEPGRTVLSGRGLPSGLPDPASQPALYRHQRPAQGRQSQAPVRRVLSRRAGAGRQDGPVELIRLSPLAQWPCAAARRWSSSLVRSSLWVAMNQR